MKSNKSQFNGIGNSIFQIDSKEYYHELRKIHSQVFTSTTREQEEKTQERYSNGNVEGIENLYTFIKILRFLFKKKKNVKGVDYGCGSHYFVNDACINYNWDVIGFDSDLGAILNAKQKYPQSASRYHVLDLLQEKIPLKSDSQDFVFCNAVIQHFSDEEFNVALYDIHRILKKEGIFLLIFKRKDKGWIELIRKNVSDGNIIDEREGKIEITDKTMKSIIESMTDEQKSQIDEKYRHGRRLLHFYSIDEVIEMSKKNGLHVISNLEYDRGNVIEKAIFTYKSGKKIPNAAIYFTKK